MTLVSDLNRLYSNHAALYEVDFEQSGFNWINADDSENSVLSYCRHALDKTETLLVLLNFTPVPRDNYRIGVEKAGTYIELFNSDSEQYGGTNYGNFGAIVSYEQSNSEHTSTLSVKLPPLGAVILKYVSEHAADSASGENHNQ